jgi:hypothetical protein
MKKLLTLFFVIFLKFSYAQLFAGAACGTFNNPGSGDNFRGTEPTLMVEYVSDDDAAFFLNASLYKKSIDTYSQDVYDDNGTFIGTSKTIETYNFKYLQIGFKRSLAGDFSDSRVNWFTAGGAMLGFVNATNKGDFMGNIINSDKYNYMIGGLSFNTGVQYRIKRVIWKLRVTWIFLLNQLWQVTLVVI